MCTVLLPPGVNPIAVNYIPYNYVPLKRIGGPRIRNRKEALVICFLRLDELGKPEEYQRVHANDPAKINTGHFPSTPQRH
jgi:hypothetical protein